MTKENNRQTFIRWLIEGTLKEHSVRITAAIDHRAKVLEEALDIMAKYGADFDDVTFFIESDKYDFEDCARAFDELTEKYSDDNACEVIDKALKACDELERMHFYLRNYQ